MQKESGKRVANAPKPEKVKKPKRPSRLTKQQKWLLAGVVVLAAALLAVVLWRSLFVRPELPGRDGSPSSGDQPGQEAEGIDYGDGVQPRTTGERKSDAFYTILILGRDTGGGGQTDTMLLASYDVTNQKATVMSIPRDTMVNVSWDVKKINSVYNVYGGGEKGIQHVYKEVSQLVGFEPDYQVVVEWEAVGEIVEAIGGVWFDVPYDMNYHDPYQDLVIEQAKGYRKLSGEDAMQVVRWRKNDRGTQVGDSGRMKIQQDFLKAVIKQLLTIRNVTNIGKISQVFRDNVTTDLTFQNILWFGQQAVFGGLKVEDVEFLTMPWRGVYAWSRSYHQNLDYVVPISSQLLDIVNNKLSPFAEKFKLSDLDIMSVNSDGSISSSTGRVEDARAALPPEKPDEEGDPEVDENGNPIDPETGLPLDPGGGGASAGNTPGTVPGWTDPGANQDPDWNDPGWTDPGANQDPADPGWEDPWVPEPGGGDPSGDGGFAALEPPPEE